VNAGIPTADRVSVLHAREIWLPRTETWLANLVGHLPPDIVNHVVCRSRANRDEFPLDRVHCQAEAHWGRYRMASGLAGLWTSSRTAHLKWVVGRVMPDILHSHFAFEGWANRRAARSAGMGHVVSCYGLDVSRLPVRDPVWRRRYRDLFGVVDRVLCEGPRMADKVVALGCDRDRISIHALGVDLKRIESRAPEWRPGEPLRILVAASFREKKGIPQAVEAAGIVGRRHPVEVTVIGDAAADPASQQEKRRIEEAAAASGLGSRIRFLGYQPHGVLFDEAKRHHVFLHPSRTASDGDDEGGAPVSIIEMGAAGLIVVSTRHCDIVGVVKDGETGLLSAEGDVGGLVANLEWLLGNPGRWRTMAALARSHIDRNFDAETQGRRLAGIYRALSASVREGRPKPEAVSNSTEARVFSRL
jgi:colanic acid/amylovoran biosynthesis glycosyltransferase